MARWIVDVVVPVNALVPEAYAHWRPPVRDAMMFVVARLSPARLAPKLLEQIELPANTPAEVRLLRLIAKVPGLQKLGQVIARNQHLHPALRNALGKLENGIRDVKAEDIRAIVQRDLGRQIQTYAVKIARRFCRRRASARWCDSPGAILNQATPARRFQSPEAAYPQYFAEDMDYLRDWRNTSETGTTRTDFPLISSPILSGRCGACCGTR